MSNDLILELAEIIENLQFRTEHGDECNLDYASAVALRDFVKKLQLASTAIKEG